MKIGNLRFGKVPPLWLKCDKRKRKFIYWNWEHNPETYERNDRMQISPTRREKIFQFVFMRTFYILYWKRYPFSENNIEGKRHY